MRAFTLDAGTAAQRTVPGIPYAMPIEGPEALQATVMRQDIAEVQGSLAKGGRAARALLGDDRMASYGWMSYKEARPSEMNAQALLAVPVDPDIS